MNKNYKFTINNIIHKWASINITSINLTNIKTKGYFYGI